MFKRCSGMIARSSIVFVGLVFAANLFAQVTERVPVTFYDFKAFPQDTLDDFEPSNAWGTGNQTDPGMVKSTLNSETGKPEFLASVYWNDNVDKWYTPNGGDPVSNYTYTYDSLTERWRWDGLEPVPGTTDEFRAPNWSSTADHANYVIYDELEFVKAGSGYPEGTYIFADSSFFPLDGRGLVDAGLEDTHTETGNYCWLICHADSNSWATNGIWYDPNETLESQKQMLTDVLGWNKPHNYGFSMELHKTFTYLQSANQFFTFQGDDDLWVFIDGKLVLDMGGMHFMVERSFNLNEENINKNLGLVSGQEYQMDVFFAERAAWASTIKITTNLIQPVPSGLELVYKDTLVAGDTIPIHAILRDQFGNQLTDLSREVTWEIVSSQSGDNISPTKDSTTWLTATKAHRTIQVKASFSGPEFSDIEIATIQIVPAKIAELKIEDVNGTDLGSQIVLDHQGPDDITLYARGYDEFGNKISQNGEVNADWGKTGTLHEPGGSGVPSVYFTSEGVPGDESGTIRAYLAGDSTIWDDVEIFIDGPGIGLKEAITRDHTANGLLDAFELVFQESVVFPDDYNLNDFTITHNTVDANNKNITVKWTVDSIVPGIGDESKRFTVYVAENNSANQPQTGWLPYVSFPALNSNTPAVSNRKCIDGAGPVVWSVEKVVSPDGNRERDRITITFSEKVSELDLTKSPKDMLKLWIVEDDGDTTDVSSLLDGINAFSGAADDWARFYTSNGADINGNHLVSIKVGDEVYVVDLKDNKPLPENRPVRVVVMGAIGPIVIGPNPLIPIFKHDEDVLTYRPPEQAFQWARDEGGAVMVANVVLPTDKSIEVKARLLVFDAIGNAVYMRSNDNNVIPDEWKDEWVAGSTRQLVFYWNGITDRNRRAAPGVYRCILYIDTVDDQQKFVGNVGIGR